MHLRKKNLRLLTESEYVQRVIREGTKVDEPKGKNLDFLMHHAKYDANRVRTLLPFYSPVLHELIQRIQTSLHEENEGRRAPTKHTVFTFTNTANFGSLLVASIFNAFPEFHVCLTYKTRKFYDKVNKVEVQERYLDTSGIPNGKIGVAMLSTNPINVKNLVAAGANQTVEFNPTIVKATLKAFNNEASNSTGQKIKILILDEKFAEGVDVADVGVPHFLNAPTSASQLEQASARNTRFCKSKHLEYFQGVGALAEMYFYNVKVPGKEHTLYDEIWKENLISQDDQLKSFLMDAFTTLAMRYSVDYWLNQRINMAHLQQSYEGEIIGYEYDMYRISKSVTNQQGHKSTHEFLVDPLNVLTPLPTQGRAFDAISKNVAYVEGITADQKYRLRLEPSNNHVERSAVAVRLPVGAEVEFRIPYGVDLAKKILNIGNRKQFATQAVENMINVEQRKNARENEPVELPAVDVTPERLAAAMERVQNAFGTDDRYVLIAVATLVRMGLSTPVHFVLPKSSSSSGAYPKVPPLSEYAFSWQGDSSSLTIPQGVQESFLSPTKGLSIAFLVLNDIYGRRVNLLLYTPAWKTIERFDPQGSSGTRFNTQGLDHELHRTFGAPLRYLSMVETSGLKGLRESTQAKQRLSGAIFLIFYLHSRLLEAGKILSEGKDKGRLLYVLTDPKKQAEFPAEFQRRLLREMGKNNDWENYIVTYADQMNDAGKMIQRWKKYDVNKTYWNNFLAYMEELTKWQTTLGNLDYAEKGRAPDHYEADRPLWRSADRERERNSPLRYGSEGRAGQLKYKPKPRRMEPEPIVPFPKAKPRLVRSGDDRRRDTPVKEKRNSARNAPRPEPRPITPADLRHSTIAIPSPMPPPPPQTRTERKNGWSDWLNDFLYYGGLPYMRTPNERISASATPRSEETASRGRGYIW